MAKAGTVAAAVALATVLSACQTGPDDEAMRAMSVYGRPSALAFRQARLDVRMGEMWKGGAEGRLVMLRRMLVHRLRCGGVEVVPDTWDGPAGTVAAEYSETMGTPFGSKDGSGGIHATVARMAIVATDGVTGRTAWRGTIVAEAPPPGGGRVVDGARAPGALEEDLLWRSRSLFISRFAASGVFEADGPADTPGSRPASP